MAGNVVIRPVGRDERAAWEPLWNGYLAFYKATHVAQVTGPLVRTAEAQATQTIRDNFIQPTVNAFGYTLDQFTLRWAAPTGTG